MKHLVKIFPVVLLIIICSNFSNAQTKWEFPVIKDYGPVHPLPNAAVQPDKSLQYKILFDVTKAKADHYDVNMALTHIARLINVYATGGIMPNQMKLVAVIHGPATPIVLNNTEYKKKFGKDNPNLGVISELKKNGVIFYVCGQALADNNYNQEWVNKDITIALSALTVVPTYQLRGYALMAW